MCGCSIDVYSMMTMTKAYIFEARSLHARGYWFDILCGLLVAIY